MIISNSRDGRPDPPKALDRVNVTYTPSNPRKGNKVVKRNKESVVVVEQPTSTESEIDKILREQLGIVPVATAEVVLEQVQPEVVVIEKELTPDERLLAEVRRRINNAIETLDSVLENNDILQWGKTL